MADGPLSITDFITDGSLIRLCEVTSRLIGRAVELRDVEDRVVCLSADGAWSLEAQRTAVGPGGEAEADEGVFAAPIVVDGRAIGRLVVLDDVADDPGHARLTEHFVGLLASTVSEVCQRESEQRERAEQLDALYKLSSLIVGAGAVGPIVSAGLRWAVEALGADAGVVRLIEEETGELGVRARAQASPGELPLEEPFDAERDRATFESGAVELEDMWRGAAAGTPLAGSPRGLAAVAMTYHGEPLGILSVQTREPRQWTSTELGLLRSMSQLLATAVANARLAQAEAENRRVAEQVRLGAAVQRRMLPRAAPAVGPLDIEALYEPCFELGGDFYDLFELGGHVGVMVGDVVGKGVAAALLMSAVRATLRAHARDVYDVDEIVKRTNEALCRDTLQNEFATVFYGVIDPRTLRLTYCNAGHDPPVVLRRRPGQTPAVEDLAPLTTGGMVLGVDPDQRYERGIFDLAPGDVLLAATDGLTDAMNYEGRRFGMRRARQALVDALRLDPDMPAKRIAQHIHWERRRFTGVQAPTDDTTIVVVRVGGGA